MKRKTFRDKKQFMMRLLIFVLVFGLVFTGTPWQMRAYADEEVIEEPAAEPTPEPEVEPTPEPTPEPAAEPTPEPAAEPASAPEPSGDEVIEEAVVEEENAVPVSNLDEPEVLLEDYIHVVTAEVAESYDAVSSEAMNSVIVTKTRGSRLSGAEKKLYDKLRKAIDAIACGDESSTHFTYTFAEIFPESKLAERYTAADLGLVGIDSVVTNEMAFAQGVTTATLNKYTINTGAVMRALVYDCPYALYWFDKTAGMNVNSSGSVSAEYDHQNGVWKSFCVPAESEVNIYLAVSVDYAPSSCAAYEFSEGAKPIETDAGKAKEIKNTATKAASVVTYAANNYSTDLEKLEYYKDWICKEVAYNKPAVNENQAYGDPWQLIYVFDGVNTTDVVCEGYSKAFKYLCDLTEGFSDKSLDCRIVTGLMSGGEGAERHMWNLVELGGLNYLVDVTNCDAGAVGAPSHLFMKREGDFGVTVSSFDTYSIGIKYYNVGGVVGNNEETNFDHVIDYSYDDETKGIYDDNELTLKSTSSGGGENPGGENPGENPGSGEDPNPGGGEDPDPPHEHTWGAPTYSWNSDNTKVTARRVCTGNPEDVEEETVNVTKTVTKATFAAAGKTVYSATFVNEAFEPQTKEVAIPILTVSNPVTKTYNGKAQTQSFTVKSGSTTLRAGTDYVVSYANNVHAGTATATVVINDTALYSGSKKISFTINRLTLNNSSTVFKTKYGEKYHLDGCQHLASSKIQTNVLEAEKIGLTPCSVCLGSADVSINRVGRSVAGVSVSGIVNKPYTGGAITQSPTVKLGSITLKNGTDYTLTYKNNVNVGTATVVITGKGNYTGSVSKTFQINKGTNPIVANNYVRAGSAKAQSFTISVKRNENGKITYSSNNKNIKVNKNGKVTIAKGYCGQATITITVAASASYNVTTKKITVTVSPRTPTFKSLKSTAKGKIKATWSKNSYATGYQVQYSMNSNFADATTITVGGAKSVSRVITSLNRGKKYYVRIRVYKTMGGVNYYSPWSKTKSVKVK